MKLNTAQLIACKAECSSVRVIPARRVIGCMISLARFWLAASHDYKTQLSVQEKEKVTNKNKAWIQLILRSLKQHQALDLLLLQHVLLLPGNSVLTGSMTTLRCGHSLADEKQYHCHLFLANKSQAYIIRICHLLIMFILLQHSLNKA